MISTVGLRVTWFCAKCLARDSTYQIALAGAVTPELPMNWTVAEGLTLCGACSDKYSDSVRAVDPDSLDADEFRAA